VARRLRRRFGRGASCRAGLFAAALRHALSGGQTWTPDALSRRRSSTTRLLAPCRFDITASRWSVQCSPNADESGPTLSGDLSITAGRPSAGRLSRLKLPDGTGISNVDLTSAGQANATSANFTPRLNKRLPRTANGHAIARLAFQRNASDPQAGKVTLEIREEFTSIEQAIAAIVETPRGETLFGSAPFPRTELLTALLAQLGAPAPPPCCPYCAACHQTAETFPPNFLQGSPAEVDARLRHCAPRLYVRLAMADLPPAQRAKTPMPPESMLPAFASDAQAWRSSPVRAALLAQVTQWLRAETGQPPQLETLLAAGYEALRPCLPAH
jgi:hypothetical protein